MIDFIQAIDTPIDQMSLEEIKAERSAHAWVRYKVNSMVNHLTMRLHWLRENKPYIPKEEYTRMYEDGELSAEKYKVMAMNMAKRRIYHRNCEAQIAYGSMLVDHEAAIVNILDERIEMMKTKAKPRKRGRKSKDPRKRLSWNNQKPWQPAVELRPPKKVQVNMVTQTDRLNKSAEAEMRRMAAITEWSLDKFKAIAESRGFYSMASLYNVVAQELDITVYAAERLLQSGKMSWGQTIILAAYFEMTPLEFCDVFLSGVFQEVVDGKWIATCDNKEALLDVIRTREQYPASNNSGADVD